MNGRPDTRRSPVCVPGNCGVLAGPHGQLVPETPPTPWPLHVRNFLVNLPGRPPAEEPLLATYRIYLVPISLAAHPIFPVSTAPRASEPSPSIHPADSNAPTYLLPGAPITDILQFSSATFIPPPSLSLRGHTHVLIWTPCALHGSHWRAGFTQTISSLIPSASHPLVIPAKITAPTIRNSNSGMPKLLTRPQVLSHLHLRVHFQISEPGLRGTHDLFILWCRYCPTPYLVDESFSSHEGWNPHLITLRRQYVMFFSGRLYSAHRGGMNIYLE